MNGILPFHTRTVRSSPDDTNMLAVFGITATLKVHENANFYQQTRLQHDKIK